MDYPRAPKRPTREREETPERARGGGRPAPWPISEPGPTAQLPTVRDPKPPSLRRRQANAALVLTSALLIGGISIGSAGNWGPLHWWTPGGPTGTPAPCTDSVAVPTLTATPLGGDTTATLQGSAFDSPCAGATHQNTDWWIYNDTGAAGGAVDTVWERFANADSLTRWTGAGITAGASGWNPGDTLVANVRYRPTIGAVSRVAVDTFIASSVTAYFCSNWSTGTGTAAATVLDSSSTCGTPWSDVIFGVVTDLIVSDTSASDCANRGGWPTNRVLRNRVMPGDATAGVGYDAAAGYVPTIAQGDSVHWRWYVCIPADTVNDPNLQLHASYSDTLANGGWGWGPMTVGWFFEHGPSGPTGASGDTVVTGFAASPEDGPSGGLMYMGSVDNNTPYKLRAGAQSQVYIVEMMYARVDRWAAPNGPAQALPAGNDSTWFVSGRVWDASANPDTILIPETAWRGRQWGVFTDTLVTIVRSRTTPMLAGSRSGQGYHLGAEGPDNPGGPTPRRLIEWAAFATCNTWCGPYSAARGF